MGVALGISVRLKAITKDPSRSEHHVAAAGIDPVWSRGWCTDDQVGEAIPIDIARSAGRKLHEIGVYISF